VLDPANGWQRAPLEGVPALSHTTVADTNPDLTDEFLLSSTGFTEPTTLRYGGLCSQLSGGPSRCSSGRPSSSTPAV
jgi:prolyl oligopeptidase